jgi:phage terminase large subunit-like protein
MNLEQLNQSVLSDGEAWPADGWTLLGVASSLIYDLPTETWLREHTLAELLDFLNTREEAIRRMADDPHRYGYEPFAWKLMDAFCGMPWVDPTDAAIAQAEDAKRREQLEAERAWCLRVRRTLLHQDEAVRILYVFGGNRAGKSEWAASRVVKILFARAGARAWCFHQDQDMSRQYQQPLIYKYLPAELKGDRGIRKAVTYISYKQQTGFSEEHFVLPKAEEAKPGSECDFRFYMQEFKKIQGGEIDVAWLDELAPASWVKEMKARVATRRGWIFVTFTPIEGYTPTVKAALDVARPTLESVAFVLPSDGGKEELELAMAGEDLAAALEGRPTQPAVPAGREFQRVPRVMRIPDKTGAVMFLHSFDNAFGNPRELYALHASDGTDYKKMKFYGLATRAVQQQFAFNALVHTFKLERLPRRGARYMFVDPCSGRNWFMFWVLVDRAPVGKRYWIYREWPQPGSYVPGVGDMGMWAEPGDKHDGVRGPAQNPLRWGIQRYKGEVLRLEGHRDWEIRAEDDAAGDGRTTAGAGDFSFDDDDRKAARGRPRRGIVRARPPEGVEDVEERFMDSRYGATPTQTKEGDTTLLEECDKVGLHFVPAPGGRTNEKKTHWIELVNDLLHFDEKRERGPLNEPRLLVEEGCANTIFALQNWTGEDGLEGACMDPVALLKYLVLADPEDWSTGEKAA